METKEEKIRIDGVITKALPGTSFLVKLDNDVVVTAYLCGKMRLHYIKIIPGDRVTVEVSPYDVGRGRIVKRM